MNDQSQRFWARDTPMNTATTERLGMEVLLWRLSTATPRTSSLLAQRAPVSGEEAMQDLIWKEDEIQTQAHGETQKDSLAWDRDEAQARREQMALTPSRTVQSCCICRSIDEWKWEECGGMTWRFSCVQVLNCHSFPFPTVTEEEILNSQILRVISWVFPSIPPWRGLKKVYTFTF